MATVQKKPLQNILLTKEIFLKSIHKAFTKCHKTINMYIHKGSNYRHKHTTI